MARFRGMISTQPGGQSVASFKVMTLDSSPDDSPVPEGCNPGPYGEQDGEQLFIQRVVPDSNTVFILLASTGERLCTIKSVDGQPITAFFVHECEGSNRMGAKPRRYLFAGMADGSIQMWDLSTALDQHQTRTQLLNQQFSNIQTVQVNDSKPTNPGSTTVVTGNPNINFLPSLVDQCNISKGYQTIQVKFYKIISFLNFKILLSLQILKGPTPEELLQLIDTSELAVASLNSTLNTSSNLINDNN